MLFRQCQDTFIRRYENIGYITNQLTKHDRVYDDAGALFLEQIKRKPQDIELAVDMLYSNFINVSREDIKHDFLEFIHELESDKYVVLGDTTEEMDAKEPSFSYSMENPKTITFNFLHKDKDIYFKDTSDFFYEKFHESPVVFGMQIELTAQCNERCIHCYLPNDHKLSSKKAETKMIQHVMDQAHAMGTLGITLSGGEMFLHPDAANIIKHARKNDFIINILSNATLLNDYLIDILREVRISLIQVSLYSMQPEEHDAITTVKGSHHKTLQNIKKLIEADIPVQISCPVMKINLNSYKEVLKWAYDHRIKAYTDFIMMAQTDFSTSNLANRISINECEKLIRDMLDVDEDYRMWLDIAKPKTLDLEKYAQKPVCGVGVDNICITATGDYYPCAGWQGYVLGNAYQHSLSEIWNDSERLKQLRTITNASFPMCLKCDARDYCSMCMVRNFNESGGDFLKINRHFCDIAFLNKRLVEEYKEKRNLMTANVNTKQ